MQRPEGSGEECADVVWEGLVAAGGEKNGHALLAILAGAVAEGGERVVRLACVAKERAEEFAVALENVELGMEGGAEAIFEVEMLIGECRGNPVSVFGLNVVVIGLDDGFFAGEIVVGGAEGRGRGSGEVAHGDGVEAALAKDAESGGEDVGAGKAGFGRGGGRSIEHVQIIEPSRWIVKNYFEHVRIWGSLKVSLLFAIDYSERGSILILRGRWMSS